MFHAIGDYFNRDGGQDQTENAVQDIQANLTEQLTNGTGQPQHNPENQDDY